MKFTFTTAPSLSTFVAFAAAAEPSQTCPSLEVRKEWRRLSKSERREWIDAVNCLNKKPRNGKLQPPIDTQSYSNVGFHIAPLNESSTYYDDPVCAHMNLNRRANPFTWGRHILTQWPETAVIHWTGMFLPWHRVYLHEWTNIIRKECGYQGVVPYWAWEKGERRQPLAAPLFNEPQPDSDDFLGSPLWDTDPESGLGGFSDDASDDYTLHTGALDIEVAYPVPHKLRRHYIPFPFGGAANRSAASTFTPAEVQVLLGQSNYTSFQGYLENFASMHGAIHLMMGGDMGTVCPAGSAGTANCPAQRTATFSANEPVFHLHHGNVDRLWWLWQEKSSINKNAFHGGSVQNTSSLGVFPNGQAPWLNKTTPLPGAGLWPTYTIEQTLDTRSWPWCYVYE
ncbi:hypothetical protein RSAG8_11715, partial [Rhizoctonia solani AG-8 WAC10335]